MASIVNTQHGNFFTRYLETVAENKLPRRFKRLIYISSIWGLIQSVKDPDMKLVEKLNDTLKLARHPDAFIFPMYIKSVIWKNMTSSHIKLCDADVCISELDINHLSSDDCTAIGVHFANSAPQWLVYGSEDLMVRDVALLIDQLKSYKKA